MYIYIFNMLYPIWKYVHEGVPHTQPDPRPTQTNYMPTKYKQTRSHQPRASAMPTPGQRTVGRRSWAAPPPRNHSTGKALAHCPSPTAHTQLFPTRTHLTQLTHAAPTFRPLIQLTPSHRRTEPWP